MKKLCVEVLSVSPLEQAGSLLAFCTVRISGTVTLRKVRLIHQPGQGFWIQPPQEVWIGRDGHRRHRTLVSIPKDWRQAITEAAVSSYSAHADAQEVLRAGK
jgi:DNA-binding cell septation regulator SpoVG